MCHCMQAVEWSGLVSRSGNESAGGARAVAWPAADVV